MSKWYAVTHRDSKGGAIVAALAVAAGCGGKVLDDQAVASAGAAVTATDTAQYSFESGTQGWVSSGPPITIAATDARAYAGKASLEVSFDGTEGTASAYVSSPSVPPGARVDFHVWCKSGVVSSLSPYVQQSGSGIVTENQNAMSALKASEWNTISVTVPSDATPLSQLGVQFQSESSTGRCFIDSVGWSTSQAAPPDAGQAAPPDAGQAVASGSSGNCGMQLGTTSPALCQTFDSPSPITTRSGQLDPTLWGVSRTFAVNLGQEQYNNWTTTDLVTCTGTASVQPPNDVVVCNGQLREALNDNATGEFEDGSVLVLAMYPKQPFDFANRTGTVSFDVSNDTHGSHAVWPELWITDSPAPAPFVFGSTWIAYPQNALGVKLSDAAAPGDQGECPNTDNMSSFRWTVESAAVVRNYVLEDNVAITGESDCSGADTCVQTGLMVTPLDCVAEDPNDPNGGMNHVELRISTNQIDVYATDAGTTAPLKHISVITNANLSFTRGLVWLEDVHYNADKGPPPSQREHTFAWDNLAFDGPLLARDLAYDALDEAVPGANNTVNLGQESAPHQTANWNVLGVAPSSAATAVKVLFNFYTGAGTPTVLNVNVNGNANSVAWPYPDNQSDTWRTLAVQVPASNIVSGTNVVGLGGDAYLVTSNVDIVLAGAGGVVPPSGP